MSRICKQATVVIAQLGRPEASYWAGVTGVLRNTAKPSRIIGGYRHHVAGVYAYCTDKMDSIISPCDMELDR